MITRKIKEKEMFDLKKSERQLVKEFIEILRKEFSFYSFIDQDIGTIRSASGFDFALFYQKHCFICEAKKEKNTLTHYQEKTKFDLIYSGETPYHILKFAKQYKNNLMLQICYQNDKQKELEGFLSIQKYIEYVLYAK